MEYFKNNLRFWKCQLLDPESHVEILDVRKLLRNSKETAVGHVGLEAVGVRQRKKVQEPSFGSHLLG